MTRRTASDAPNLEGYDYVRPLGSGGFSDVFLYEQHLPRRRVAVKVLVADAVTDQNRARFVAEANTMAQLSTHPYIVTIYHADVASDSRPYFVMEYCSGPSLAARYKKSPRAVDDALRTGVRVASAVATAHAAGILHRDIKPANVLVNDFGWPALTDFGIASSLSDDVAVTTTSRSLADQREAADSSSAVGLSVPWSPPEMFADMPSPDVRSDLFSLAATVWTTLAGRTPFEVAGRPNGALDLIGRIERGAVSPLTREDVPSSLVAVLHKGMATRREDRFDSVVEFARALQRVELELGYAATTLDVPLQALSVGENLDGAEEAAAPDVDAEKTRARGIVQVDPEPRPAPPHSEPETESATVVRRAEPVADPQSVSSAPVEQTVRRPGAAEAVPADAPTDSPAPDSDEPLRRRRWLVPVVIAAAAVVVIAAGSVLLSTLLPKLADTEESPTHAADTDHVVDVGGVPSPEEGDVTRSDDGTTLTFTWTNPEADDDDRYQWRRTDSTEPPTVTSATTATVSVDEGEQACIEVLIIRSGKTSVEPLKECSS